MIPVWVEQMPRVVWSITGACLGFLMLLLYMYLTIWRPVLKAKAAERKRIKQEKMDAWPYKWKVDNTGLDLILDKKLGK